MCEPSYKLFPRCPELIPCLFRQVDTSLFLVVKQVVKFFCGVPVDDDSILLVVPTEASGVQIGAANGAETPVYHYYLSMMKSRLEQPYIHSFLHQFMDIIEHAVRS